MSTLVMIMAGGKGSRLGPLTTHRAKPAMPFGGRYRIIDFVLSNFVNSGYRQIYVLTQYMAATAPATHRADANREANYEARDQLRICMEALDNATPHHPDQ